MAPVEYTTSSRPTEPRDRVLHDLTALLLVGDVARQADRGAVDLGRRLLAHLTPPRREGHVRTRRHRAAAR